MFRDTLTNHLRAGYSGLIIATAEPDRVESEIKEAAAALAMSTAHWSPYVGWTAGENAPTQCDLLEALERLNAVDNDTVVVYRDAGLTLADRAPVLLDAVRASLREAKRKGCSLVIVGADAGLPPELSHEFAQVDFDLPSVEELRAILDAVLDGNAQEVEGADRDALASAARGLTAGEAENAFALATVATKGQPNPKAVWSAKATAVRKGGLLEFVDGIDIDSVGGLGALKAWIGRRAMADTQEARDYGLPAPKGMLLVGIPGTGKSLTAKATAAALKRPLVRLDVGRVFGGLVGQSERQIRDCIQTVEAVAPCVLWVDEIN